MVLFWLLHCTRSHARLARGGFAQTFLDLVVGELGCFGDVQLVRFAKRFDQIECLGVANAAERFEQTGVYAWRVVFFFQKRVEHVRAFELGEIADGLVLATGIEILDDAIKRFGAAHAIQRPVEGKTDFLVFLLELVAFDEFELIGRGEACECFGAAAADVRVRAGESFGKLSGVRARVYAIERCGLSSDGARDKNQNTDSTDNFHCCFFFRRRAVLRSRSDTGITSTFGYFFSSSGRNSFAFPTMMMFAVFASSRVPANFCTSAGPIASTLLM